MLKIGLCAAGCGAKVEIKTNPKVFCGDCRKTRKRESARIAMAKQRRKRGVPEIKGARRNCRLCRQIFVLNRNAHAEVCISCRKEADRERARKRVNRLSRERGAPKLGEQTCCSHCGSMFERMAARNYLCPPCGAKSLQMNLSDAQKRRRREYRRKWDKLNPERAANYQRVSRSRRKKDPAFTINERMSAGIRYSLKAGKQGSSWQDLVGYTLADLMQHLELQFLPGMSWNNRGEWHIDHIRPLCSFEFQAPDCSQFREAWALTNLRPLWARDNLTKSGRLTHLL